MLLQIDAGNSRLKWRLVKAGGTDSISRGIINDLSGQQCIDALLEALAETRRDQLSRVLISCVRQDGLPDLLTRAFVDKLGLTPEFAFSQKRLYGVENAYADPGRLGVDRWLAMLAAFHDAAGACCVLDCGTTITVDVVSSSGMHQGGFIVPGFSLMQQSLVDRSPALVLGKESALPELGCTTGSAINNGVLTMVLGFISELQRKDVLVGKRAHWYLTGGDATVLAPYIEWPFSLQPDLVLDGLGLALS